MNEFELIARCFNDYTVVRDDVILGIGDDAALVDDGDRSPLISATAFVQPAADLSPQYCAERLFEAAVASLLAVGAVAHWATLVLSLRQQDQAWCTAFVHALSRRAQRYSIALVGGDTSAGDRSALLTVHGYTPRRPPPPAVRDHSKAPK